MCGIICMVCFSLDPEAYLVCKDGLILREMILPHSLVQLFQLETLTAQLIRVVLDQLHKVID